MAILIDAPRWPAHGTVFGHLVSDSSLEELHAFAARAGLPPQAFDHDHYDVPAARYDDLVAAGAEPVGERELVLRLTASGLRVRKPQRTPTRAAAQLAAQADWAAYGLPAPLRDDLLARWGEPHRRYHDVRHLACCLAALDALGATARTVRLAAWFHDAVYRGAPGEDEEASARLAESALDGLLPVPEVDEVARLVRMTADHRPADEASALLSDADLSVLGQIPGRYHVYLRDVRLDYAHLDDETWARGRLAVVEALLGAHPLFHTPIGRRLWEDAARANLSAERAALLGR
ncbi:MAG: DUF4031 domain-containing protein [Arachnia sp.]